MANLPGVITRAVRAAKALTDRHAELEEMLGRWARVRADAVDWGVTVFRQRIARQRSAGPAPGGIR
jgi:hypothetical protein